jgi:hypothetical protein
VKIEVVGTGLGRLGLSHSHSVGAFQALSGEVASGDDNSGGNDRSLGGVGGKGLSISEVEFGGRVRTKDLND